MISKQELRIGLWVRYFEDDIFIPNESHLSQAFLHLDYGFLAGIPLTPDWIERLNVAPIITFANDVCYIDLDQGQQFSGVCLNHIKYVHQLQNLYFALSGNEL